MKEDNELTLINRYCSPFSLLVLTSKKLIRIYCPFTVEAIYNSYGIEKGGIYQVRKVQVQADSKLVYTIKDTAYIYSLFRIII